MLWLLTAVLGIEAANSAALVAVLRGTGLRIVSDLLSNSQISAVAALHQENIDRGFLSQLGPGFLFYLYKSISDSDASFLLVAYQDDEVAGFVSGCVRFGSVYKHLMRHHLLGAVVSVLPRMLSWQRMRKVWELLFYSKADDPSNFPEAELLSLAVDQRFRRLGVARDLFLALKKAFAKHGVNEFKIVVGEELIGAQRFYERMGAEKIGEVEVHAGERSLVYKVTIC